MNGTIKFKENKRKTGNTERFILVGNRGMTVFSTNGKFEASIVNAKIYKNEKAAHIAKANMSCKNAGVSVMEYHHFVELGGLSN